MTKAPVANSTYGLGLGDLTPGPPGARFGHPGSNDGFKSCFAVGGAVRGRIFAAFANSDGGFRLTNQIINTVGGLYSA